MRFTLIDSEDSCMTEVIVDQEQSSPKHLCSLCSTLLAIVVPTFANYLINYSGFTSHTHSSISIFLESEGGLAITFIY